MINRASLKWFFAENYFNKRIVFLLSLVFVFDILYILSKTYSGGADTVVLLFYGCSGGNFVLIDVLFFLIFNLMPIYFSTVIFDSNKIKTQYVIIRFRKKSEYYLVSELSFCFFLSVYFTAHLLSAVIYNFLFTGSETRFSVNSEILYDVAYTHIGFVVAAAVFLRFSELIFVQKLLAVVHSFFGNLTIEFIVLSAGYFFVPFVNYKLYPLGLSSISRMLLFGVSFEKYIVMTVLIYVVGSVIIDIFMCKKGIKNLLEK